MTKRLLSLFETLCVSVDDKFYSLLRGELYSAIEDEEGMPEIYCYNFGKLVVPSTQQVVFHIDRILCKIMLYPDPENLANPSHFIIIDSMRKRLPVSYGDVIVPIYLQCGDMVIVSCEDGNDYIANITNVQEGQKTAKVFFYLDGMCEKAMDMVPCIQWHGIASKALLMVTGKEMCGSNNLLSVLKWCSTITQRSLRDPYPRPLSMFTW